MTHFLDNELPLRGAHKFSRKRWFSVTLFPIIFFVPITASYINQYISNPHNPIPSFQGWWIVFIMFMVFSLIGAWSLKKHFRCKMCNIPMCKRIHSLYCNSCRPFVKRSLECWPNTISCRLCNVECENYLSYQNHFDQFHNNSDKKPWIRYHPEDNAIRKTA